MLLYNGSVINCLMPLFEIQYILSDNMRCQQREEVEVVHRDET